MKARIDLLMTITLLAGMHHTVAQSFTLISSPDAGSVPLSITAADVNGDGELDLISADYGFGGHGNTLDVLTNNGNGSFVLAFELGPTQGVGMGPISVVAADVNGDGKVDLICANQTDNSISVLTNNGNGGFASSGKFSVGNGPVCVIATDVKGDGKLDLICANSHDNTLTVLTNSGNGVFGSNATLQVGAYPQSIVAADINGDGKLDLICANSGNIGNGTSTGHTLTVLTNNGSGGFGFNATLNVGTFPQAVVAADINGDGKVDIISANAGVSTQEDGTLTVLTNNGAGIFGSNATYTVGILNGFPGSLAVADVNGDGKLDLINANNGDTTISVLTNNGSGGFVLSSSPIVGDGPESLIAADVNGSGKADLICVNYANQLQVLLNTSTFPPPASTPPLTMKRSGIGVQVSWPSASAGWSLQQNPDLTTKHWGPSGYGGYNISDNGTNKSLSIPSQPGNLFFRLLHP